MSALDDNLRKASAYLERFKRDGVLNHIAGEAVPAADGSTFETISPVDLKPLAKVAHGKAADIDRAAKAAKAAFRDWAAMSGDARKKLLHKIADAIVARAEEIAFVECMDTGQSLKFMAKAALRGAENFRFYADRAPQARDGRTLQDAGQVNMTTRVPIGLVGIITPWNAPLFTGGWQIAPAICAGNAVVIKPSELTPLSTLILGILCEKGGAPRGLVNVLAGAGPTAGQAAVGHRRTGLVVFVGSAHAGSMIAATAARNVVPCILELGGKSANIVFGDAEIDRAVLGAQSAIFGGAGQSCVAGSRLLVHRSVHEAFVERYVRATEKIPVGDPFLDTTQIGPINNARQWNKIDEMVRQGVREGARLATGGGRPAELEATGGFYFAPTILDNAGPDMTISREEVFGPVVGVTPFDSEEEAIALANDNPYGLAGAVWTQNVARAHRVASQVRAGTFWVNGYKTISVMSPFGGFGRSGYGRSSGRDALLAYTQTKSVWVETAADPVVSFGYSAG